MDLDDEEETGALTAMEMLNDVDTEVSEYTPNTIVLQLFLSFPILLSPLYFLSLPLLTHTAHFASITYIYSFCTLATRTPLYRLWGSGGRAWEKGKEE